LRRIIRFGAHRSSAQMLEIKRGGCLPPRISMEIVG
jgi:hypothetical protein